MHLIFECKNQTRYVHHKSSEYKSNSHRYENGSNHSQSLTGVYVIAKIGTRVSPCLNHGKSKRSTKQFKHHRNRGRSRHSERIEYIKQHNVRYHYRKEDCHNLAEREQIGLKHSMTGNVHHAVAHNRTAEYAYGSYCNNCTKLGSL